MTKTKTLLTLILITAAAYGAWNLRSDREAVEPAEPKDALDRLWIDHMPKNDKDIINVFVAITEQPFGVFQAASQWKGNFELFRYEMHGGELRLIFGQTNEREAVKVRASKCSEKGMDYCLELDGASRGVKRYYSMKGWEIDGARSIDDVRARVDSLVNTPQ